MPSLATLQAQLTELLERRHATAGIRNTAFSDQSTTFDGDDLDKRIAQLESQIAAATGRSTTRYVATSKGV